MGEKPGDAARNAAIEHAAVSATAAVVGVVTGNPFAGLAAAAAMKGGLGWLRSLAEGSDKALQSARFAELEEAFAKLDERTSRLERDAAAAGHSEQRSATARNEIYSAFAIEVARAQTDVRREALINAAARQFDAREGNQAVRKLWFERVAALDDVEAWVIANLAEAKYGYYPASGRLVRKAGPEGEASDVSMCDADQIAFGRALLELAERLEWVVGTGEKAVQSRNAPPLTTLTPAGRILARFMSEPK